MHITVADVLYNFGITRTARGRGLWMAKLIPVDSLTGPAAFYRLAALRPGTASTSGAPTAAWWYSRSPWSAAT